VSACDSIREIIPWYVGGGLSGEEASRVAAHLATCEACREELATTLRVHLATRAAFGDIPRPEPELWERVRDLTHGAPLGRLDLGSFLAGFSVGARVVGSRLPIRGDLRLLGRNVRLFDIQKGGSK
jgi:anti-sigma factor RsiW